MASAKMSQATLSRTIAGYSKRKAVSELASPPKRPKVAETLHPGVTEISTGCTLIYEQSAFPDPQREEHLAFLKVQAATPPRVLQPSAQPSTDN